VGRARPAAVGEHRHRGDDRNRPPQCPSRATHPSYFSVSRLIGRLLPGGWRITAGFDGFRDPPGADPRVDRAQAARNGLRRVTPDGARISEPRAYAPIPRISLSAVAAPSASELPGHVRVPASYPHSATHGFPRVVAPSARCRQPARKPTSSFGLGPALPRKRLPTGRACVVSPHLACSSSALRLGRRQRTSRLTARFSIACIRLPTKRDGNVPADASSCGTSRVPGKSRPQTLRQQGSPAKLSSRAPITREQG